MRTGYQDLESEEHHDEILNKSVQGGVKGLGNLEVDWTCRMLLYGDITPVLQVGHDELSRDF
jgi:hypothetical protein